MLCLRYLRLNATGRRLLLFLLFALFLSLGGSSSRFDIFKHVLLHHCYDALLERVALCGFNNGANLALGVGSACDQIEFVCPVSALLFLVLELVISLRLFVFVLFVEETLEVDADCAPFLGSCIHLSQLLEEGLVVNKLAHFIKIL